MSMSNFDRVIDHLSRFPSEYHDDLIETLVQSPRVAQLASSYPLLVLLLATGYGSDAARKDAVARANEGASLGKIAEALSLPLSLRRVPPEACVNLPFASWSTDASRELASLIPKTAAAAASWLKTIFHAHIRCDETFALWIARQRPLFTGRQLPDLPLQGLAAYAWCSRFSPIPIDEPLTAPWQPDVGLDTACSRAGLWAREIAIVADLSPSGLPAAWVPQADLDGLLFTPILTPESLIAEARVMANCVVSYSERMAKGNSRLYSVTRNGRRVATVEIIW
ncbi:MAG: hypothetical protein K2Y05_00915, partial [Hyphomicrobiaceae bacterium]|nr:hypothetical protein [Hyphomicrobiaceae bacterium]